jgi:hypothetical protein
MCAVPGEGFHRPRIFPGGFGDGLACSAERSRAATSTFAARILDAATSRAPRSRAGIAAQRLRLPSADANASSRSACVAEATSPKTASVAGLRMGSTAPSAAERHAPLMKSLKLAMLASFVGSSGPVKCRCVASSISF